MSRVKRLIHSFFFTLNRGRKKALYANKHGLFAYYGHGVVFQPHIIPLYSQLIKLHDNVVVGRNVEFITHDVIHHVINASPLCDHDFRERVGCIEVMDNVFIGNGAVIMYGVRLAENSIIAAGSVVTKSTEANLVYAGVPARKIGVFSDTAEKRKVGEHTGTISTVTINQRITDDEISGAWDVFYQANQS